ncbi:MAG: ArnT family glycosyltransferase [Blastocatellia bacterium]
MSGTASKHGGEGSSDEKGEFPAALRGNSTPGPTAKKISPARMAGPLAVLLIAAAVYGSIYFREESISTGIGANLVPAERVLKGEVPYRDFYKIQTPGILLLNAGLFKLLGTSLLTALKGVLAFKILTVVMVFLIARLIVPSPVAALPALLSMIWLPPGGPFRPAPIQYEMAFILAAIYFMLLWVDSRKAADVFAAGLAVGMVAVFKQNVGIYMALALGLVIILNTRALPRSFKEATRVYFDSWRVNARAHAAAAVGVGLPLTGLFVYLAINRALAAAARVFVRGPAEHLQMKFNGYPLPKYAAVMLLAGAAGLMLTRFLIRKAPGRRALLVALALCAACGCAVLAPRGAVDNSIYWFAPLLFLYSAWRYVKANGGKPAEFGAGSRERGVLLILLLFSAASYGEVFPRSVRGLLIGTLPPALLLFTFLFGRAASFKQQIERAEVRASDRFTPPDRRLVFAAVTIVLAVFAFRVILPHYFQFDPGRGVRFKADMELAFDRGRGVYLPAARASEVSAAVDFIRSRVPEGGYFFAHALDSTSYYFLADRNSPTGATLWNDAGTDDGERERTLRSLRNKQVRLVVTSAQAASAERYAPLLDYMKDSFHQGGAAGKLIFLERNY